MPLTFKDSDPLVGKVVKMHLEISSGAKRSMHIPNDANHQVAGEPQCEGFKWLRYESAELNNIGCENRTAV